jgi:DinB superfamily
MASRIARYNSGMIRQQHLKFLAFPAVLVSAMMLTTMACGQAKPAEAPPTLRSVLLSQLRSTHNKAEWFVPVDAAIAGLTAEQAKWVPTNAAGKVDANASHSSGMLAYHLLFWNNNALAGLKGEKAAPVPGNNDETFNDFDAANWAKTVHDLDAVLSSIEDVVEHADEARLEQIAGTISHISTHNAYHTGQILYVRKLQGSWNPANGVK